MVSRFVSQRDITDAAALTPLERAQLREAGLRYDELDITAEERLAEDGDEESSFAAGFCTLWQVADGDVPRYDAWLYQVDSGTIFRAGTTEVVAEIIQFGLECDDPAVRAELGPAMVEAKLLPRSDSDHARFSALLAEQES